MINILTNIPLSLVLTFISSIAALLTAYYSYRAIKVSRELFYKAQIIDEQRLLPLFNVYRNYKFLDDEGQLDYKNPNTDDIISIYCKYK